MSKTKSKWLTASQASTIAIMILVTIVGMYVLMTFGYWKIEITNELGILEMIVHTEVQLARIEVLRLDSILCYSGICICLFCTVGLICKGMYELVSHSNTFRNRKDAVRLVLITLVVSVLLYFIWF